jgi:hypothetical protein
VNSLKHRPSQLGIGWERHDCLKRQPQFSGQIVAVLAQPMFAISVSAEPINLVGGSGKSANHWRRSVIEPIHKGGNRPLLLVHNGAHTLDLIRCSRAQIRWRVWNLNPRHVAHCVSVRLA